MLNRPDNEEVADNLNALVRYVHAKKSEMNLLPIGVTG